LTGRLRMNWFLVGAAVVVVGLFAGLYWLQTRVEPEGRGTDNDDWMRGGPSL